MISVGFGRTGALGSNSWGYSYPNVAYSNVLAAVIDYATGQGVLVVLAAGNWQSNEAFFPGAYEKLIAVAATYDTVERAPFSNYGSWMDIAAPGVNIMPTGYSQENACDGAIGDPYITMSGTSMACPHVAGVLALGKSYGPSQELRPQATGRQLKRWLLDTASHEATCDDPTLADYGTGMVNPPVFFAMCCASIGYYCLLY
ncbi:hypothetical protein ACA910_007149 [Epithemia clementina (nom. ined.)]